MNQISLFRPGALVWLPANTKRFKWGTDVQLELFPEEYSITKIPLIGVLKGYSNRGDCEVLFPDGLWDVEPKELYSYEDSPHQRRKNDRISTNKKA
tara:strand:- start:248 stop:535 length:288 start_codon:yes stop_codon:yes gene_type:complete